jgi:cell division protein FtsB
MERLSRTLFWAVLALAGYYALFGGRYSVFEVRAGASERDELRIHLDSLRSVNDGLAARVDALENDPAALEQVAREEYGMVRPGELIYRPSNEADTTGGASPR